MRTHTIDILASSLALPLNSAAQKADGARFALMLSLLSEGRYAEPVQTEDRTDVPLMHNTAVAPAYHLDLSLNQALQHHSPYSFNLLNSIYSERDRYLYSAPDISPPPINTPDRPSDKAGPPEALMREIAQSREQALLMG